MRPAGRGDQDSLYFQYPEFSQPRGADREHLSASVQVAIVGAGPVGMVAALALARHGVRSVLLEVRSTFNDGSRAICVARQSYRTFDSLGVVEPFLEKSLPWTTGRSFFQGTQILEFRMPDSEHEKFRPMYNLQQQFIEQFLWEEISRNPRIETRWLSNVVGIDSNNKGAVLEVADPEGSYSLHAEWVLAADGARSAIRRMMGLRLRGENHEGRYVIADVQMQHNYPTIRRALFDPPSRPGGTVLVHKQPDNIWRIDYQLNDEENADDAIREEVVRDSVTRVLQDLGHEGPWDLEWWSIYSANTLALDDYRHGHVFFVGDSAHIVPIFGVRGLNNGIADAHNIGWKLAWVLQGKAGSTLLDSYTPERRGATLDVFENASKSARFMTPPSAGWKIMRDAALRLARRHPFAGELANPRQMTPFTYAGSPAVLEDDPAFNNRSPIPGAAMVDIALDEGHLSERLGSDFTCVCFDNALARQVAALPRSPIVVHLPFSPQLADRLAADRTSAYLVRPDLHVGARFKVATADMIERTLDRLLFRDVLQ